LAPNIDLPNEEIGELKRLLEEQAGERPSEVGVGYRRRNLTQRLTCTWSMKIPGYFYETAEDDGTHLVFWFPGRTVRFTSFTVDNKDGSKARTWDVLKKRGGDKTDGGETVEIDKEDVKGRGVIRWTSEEGEEYWQLQGEAYTYNGVAIVTVCYDDEADKAWAIDVFRSLSCGKQED